MKEIESEIFYTCKTTASVNPLLKFTAPNRVFQSFFRQELAFEHFDSLIFDVKSKCKLFSYESAQNGQRMFLVANFDVFLYEYYTVILSKELRHAYEIIRENIPCRGYFDLEFNRKHNGDVNGDKLTAKWIDLVVWKLYSLYGIYAGPQHVLVLDSTTDDKYSKHVSLILSNVSTVRRSSGSTEHIFANNAEVGLVVQRILFDITEPVDITTSDINEMDIVDINSQKRRPLLAYADLWVNAPSSSGGVVGVEGAEQPVNRKTCFVDTGVYTRNRAFRLFGSCKYGKTKQLSLSIHDARRYSGGACSSPSPARKKELGRMRADLLKRSLVVPHDVLGSEKVNTLSVATGPCVNGRKDAAPVSVSSSSPIHLNTHKYSLLPSLAALIADNTLRARQIHRANTDELPAKRRLNGERVEGVFGSNVEIARSARHREPSWFPLVDDLVATRFASVGGPRGVLTSWVLTSSSQTFVSASQENASVVNAPRVFHFYKLRYQVSGNRWCRNVNRAHRSNGVAIEVDLTRKEVVQTCWDADCKRFRSPPEPLFDELPPPEVQSLLGLPLSGDDLHSLVLDRCLTEAMRADPHLWGGDV